MTPATPPLCTETGGTSLGLMQLQNKGAVLLRMGSSVLPGMDGFAAASFAADAFEHT